MTPKDRCCQRRIHFFRTYIPKLAVENEIVALGAQVNGGFLAEEDESEDIAILYVRSRSEIGNPIRDPGAIILSHDS